MMVQFGDCWGQVLGWQHCLGRCWKQHFRSGHPFLPWPMRARALPKDSQKQPREFSGGNCTDRGQGSDVSGY